MKGICCKNIDPQYYFKCCCDSQPERHRVKALEDDCHRRDPEDGNYSVNTPASERMKYASSELEPGKEDKGPDKDCKRLLNQGAKSRQPWQLRGLSNNSCTSCQNWRPGRRTNKGPCQCWVLRPQSPKKEGFLTSRSLQLSKQTATVSTKPSARNRPDTVFGALQILTHLSRKHPMG